MSSISTVHETAINCPYRLVDNNSVRAYYVCMADNGRRPFSYSMFDSTLSRIRGRDSETLPLTLADQVSVMGRYIRMAHSVSQHLYRTRCWLPSYLKSNGFQHAWHPPNIVHIHTGVETSRALKYRIGLTSPSLRDF